MSSLVFETLSRIEGISCLSPIDPATHSVLARNGVKEGCRFVLELSNRRRVPLVYGVTETFPRSLPICAVDPPDAIGFIPHVMSNGYVCYLQAEGTLLDPDNPAGIIRESILQIDSVLTAGIEGKNKDDFLDEFESYWADSQVACQPYVDSIISFVPPPRSIGEYGAVFFPYAPAIIIYDSYGHLKTLISRFFGLFSPILIPLPTLVIWLRLERPLYPPRPGRFWRPDRFRELILERLSPGTREELFDILSRRNRERDLQRETLARKQNQNETELNKNDLLRSSFIEKLWSKDYLLFTFDTPKGREATGAIEISAEFEAEAGSLLRYTSTHILGFNPKVHQISPVNVGRLDRNYLIARTGGAVDLGDKHVAVVGCGAVGSHVAVELAKAGITKLTLIDPDRMAPENVHRHVIGMMDAHERNSENQTLSTRFKVDALHLELTMKYPFVTVNALRHRIESLINNNPEKLKEFDLIIVAVGHPQTELYLNKVLQSTEGMPPTLFTWLEPYGIGGHALLTLNQGRSGCFACLYGSRSDDDSLYNCASFAAPNQSFAISVTGCSGTFTPYGSLDAVQTAILAVRLAISVLEGKEPDNPLLSWKGSRELFEAKGHVVSDRYVQATSESIWAKRYSYKDPKCPVCSWRGN